MVIYSAQLGIKDSDIIVRNFLYLFLARWKRLLVMSKIITN